MAVEDNNGEANQSSIALNLQLSLNFAEHQLTNAAQRNTLATSARRAAGGGRNTNGASLVS